MSTIFASILILWLGAMIVFVYPIGNRRYVYIFEHRLWDGWKNVIAHFDSIKYVEYNECSRYPMAENHMFTITIDGQECSLMYWIKTGEISIHDYIDEKESCLTPFDKYHHEIVKKLLYEKFDFMKQYE